MDSIMLVPGAYALALLDAAAGFDVSHAELLSGLDLTRDVLARPHMRIEASVFRELAARAVRSTGEPGLAVHLGASLRAPAHGYLGFAMLSAPTLGDALAIAARYAPTRLEWLALELRTDGDEAALALVEQSPLGDTRELAIVACAIGLARLACELAPDARVSIDVAAPEPAYAQRLAHLAPGPVRWGAPATRVAFSRELLERPVPHANEAGAALAREQCERELGSIGGGGVPARVRQLLPRAGDGFRSLEEVAHKLAVSPRTLKRSLAANGTRFSDLLDELRCNRAVKLLALPGQTLEDIAHRLGYADVAGFTRAFRRWTGDSPGAYRRRRADGTQPPPDAPVGPRM